MSIAKFDWSVTATNPTPTAVIPLKVASASFKIEIVGPTPITLTAALTDTSVLSPDLAPGTYSFTFTTLDTAGAPVAHPDGSAIAPLTGSFVSVPAQVTGIVVTSVAVSV
jgi:hypothetical protein